MGVNICVCVRLPHTLECAHCCNRTLLIRMNLKYFSDVKRNIFVHLPLFPGSRIRRLLLWGDSSFDCCCRRHLFSALQSLPSSRLLASLSSLSSSWKRSHISNDDLRPVIKIRVMQMSFETHILVWLANYLLPTYPASYLARWGWTWQRWRRRRRTSFT